MAYEPWSDPLTKELKLTNAQLLDLRVYALERELEVIHMFNHMLVEHTEEGEPWMPGKNHQFHFARGIMEFLKTGGIESEL